MMWLLNEEEIEKAVNDYRESCSIAEFIPLQLGNYEHAFPVIAQAALRKVARILEEHGAVSARRNIPDSDWTVSLPLGMVKSLFEEAGLVQENESNDTP